MSILATQLCDMLEAKLKEQTPHEVHPRIELLQVHPERLEATIRMATVVTTLPLDKVDQWRKQREAKIAREKADPLRFLCEPDEYRLIDLECAKKRRNKPGVPLLLWLSGGIRSAKTYFCSRRLMAVHWHTKDAWTWGVHETDLTSGTVMQPLIHDFVPKEIRDAGSKQTVQAKRGMAAADSTYFSFTPGAGFTGSKFFMKWRAHDWRGCASPDTCTPQKPCRHVGELGGMCEFRFYKQDSGTFVGQKITAVMNDELVPPETVLLEEDRLIQRSQDTATPEYLARLDQIIAKLEGGEPADIYDLACIYLGWQFCSFTPKLGWTAMVNMILQKARKYGFYDPRPMVEVAMKERLAREPDAARKRALEAELKAKPWTLGGITKVPRFAQAINPRWLVAYLPTWANKFGGNWPGLVESLQGKSDDDIAQTAFGDVRRNVQCLLPYEDEKHVLGWDSMPFISTVYEFVDPAPGKPWVIKWYVVDAAGRRRVIQEWPNPEWEIEGRGFPDAWAIPSRTNKLNGDKGVIAQARLGWGLDHYTRLIWQGRQRLAARFKAEAARRGEAHSIPTQKLTLEWSAKPEWKLEGEFVRVARTLGDRHYLSLPTQQGGGTLLLELLKCENHLRWENANAERESEGLTLLSTAMSNDIMGLPSMSCTPECTNTQFAWGTYTIPPDKLSSVSTDEACKDFVDPDRYLIMEREAVCYLPPELYCHDEHAEDVVAGCY